MILDDIISVYREMGVRRGDVIEVSSDVRTAIMCMRHEEKAAGAEPKTFAAYMDDIIDALQNLVGREGTLLFPAFTWKFCKGQ